VAERYVTDVPEWAKSERGAEITIEKTTGMAFYTLSSAEVMNVRYDLNGRSSSIYEIRISDFEPIRPDLPDHLYLFTPANEHVSFAMTYDMSCSSVMLSLPDGKRLIASDSRYDMVFSESTTLDFTVEYAQSGFKDLPLSTTVFVSAEGFTEPDGLAAPAAALCLLVFIAVAAALAIARLRGRRAGAD